MKRLFDTATERLIHQRQALGAAAVALPCALLLMGCGDAGETTPEPGEGGGGGGAPLECVLEDPFDPAQCPATYPEWDCVAYVDSAVASSGDGWSWQSAVKTVQEGIDLARCGALNGGVCEQWQVWVEQGHYYINQGCREHSVQLRPNVSVYGGFTGTETTVEERDWEANATILDGRDGPEGGSHAYHVVIGADDAAIDGFTIQWGRADHPDDILLRNGAGMGNAGVSPTVANCVFRHNVAVEAGGGMVNVGEASPSVAGCSFVQNEAGTTGGAIVHSAGSPMTISATTFLANHAEQHGGAIAASGASNLDISDSIFRENTSGAHGGGLFCSDGTLSITDSTFVANVAHDQGGAIDVGEAATTVTNSTFHSNEAHHGGAMRAWGASASVTGCSFTDNKAVTSELGKGSGGALKFGGGGLGFVEDCSLSGNTASAAGGAIIVEVEEVDGGVTVSGSTFDRNVSEGGGGAIQMWGEATGLNVVESSFTDNAAQSGGALGVSGSVDLAQCEFRNNTAQQWGGGIMMSTGAALDIVSSAFFGNSALIGGAIEAETAGPLSLLHCTVAHNRATTRGGAIAGAADLTVTSSIIWGPSESLIADSGSVAQAITYSNFPGGELTGANNTGAMPTFVGPGRGDLHLQSTSECIDAADGDAAPATDLDGSSRVGAPDMGAYEFQPTN